MREVPQRDVGDDLSRFFDDVPDQGAVTLSVHRSEDGVIAVLDGYVQVMADLRFLGHGLKELFRQMGRIGIEDADPGNAVDPGQRTQKAAQRRLTFPVQTVGRRILGGNDQFTHALCGEKFRLSDDVVYRPASGLSTDGGNRAVGTAVGATVGALPTPPCRPLWSGSPAWPCSGSDGRSWSGRRSPSWGGG